MFPKKEEITLTTKLKANAHQKDSTINPGTIEDANKTIKVFITKVNNPKVRIFIGNVKITKIGLRNKFNAPKTIATKIAVTKLSISTPGKM